MRTMWLLFPSFPRVKESGYHLAGLAEALRGVIVRRAHLHCLGPGASFVVGVGVFVSPLGL
jgi:hypothetical protein